MSKAIPHETHCGQFTVVYTPDLDLMSIKKQGLLVVEHVEDVPRVGDESIEAWYDRACARANTLADA